MNIVFGLNGLNENNAQNFGSLPENLRRLLVAATKGRSSVEMALPVLLGVISTLCQGKFKTTIIDDFETQLSTFNIAVADSSEGKGQVFSTFFNPIYDLVNACNDEIKRHNSQITTINKAIKARIKELQKRCAKAQLPHVRSFLAEMQELEGKIMKEKNQVIFATQDTTSAGLVKILRNQEGNRVGIIDPEGRSLRSLRHEPFFQSLLNSAFDGEFINNTTAKDEILAGFRPLISLVALIQPSKLAKLTKRHAYWDEGFFPRTLVFFPPSLAGSRSILGQIHDHAILGWYKEKIEYLLKYPWNMQPDGSIAPWTISISAEALEIWKEAALWFETQQGLLSPMRHLKSWLGKAPTLIARLATLFSILDASSDPVITPVSWQYMQCAAYCVKASIANIDFLFHQIYPDPVRTAIKKIYRELYTLLGSVGYITVREVCRLTHLKMEVIDPALSFFVKAGVLNPCAQTENRVTSSNYGRPKSFGYQINYNALKMLDYNSL